jgi:hypothetical protein
MEQPIMLLAILEDVRHAENLPVIWESALQRELNEA